MSAPEFFNGGHALCIDDRWAYGMFAPCPVEKGRVYTIREVCLGEGWDADGRYRVDTCLTLIDVNLYGESWPLFATRFRPLDESVLTWARELAANPPATVDEVA